MFALAYTSFAPTMALVLVILGFQLVMGLRAATLRDILLVRLPCQWMHRLPRCAPQITAILSALGRRLYSILVELNDPRPRRGARTGRGVGWRLAFGCAIFCGLATLCVVRFEHGIRVGRSIALPVALGICVYLTLAETKGTRRCRGARRGRHLCWRLVTCGECVRTFVSAVKPCSSHRHNGFHTLRTTSSSSQTACGEAHSTYATNRVGRSMAPPVALGTCVYQTLAETKGTRRSRGARRGQHLCWRLVTWFGDHDRSFVRAAKPHTGLRRNGSHTLRTSFSSSQTARGEAHSTCSMGTHGPRVARHGTRGPFGHIMDALRSLRLTARYPWSPHALRGPRPWGIVCSMGTDGSKDSDSDDDSSDDDGLRDRKSRSKVVLPDFDGTVENWMSWHVACLAYFRRIRREDYLLDTATAPPVLDSLDDYKDYSASE